MGRRLRVLAVLTALSYAPVGLAGPRELGKPPRKGDSGRVVEAPNDLSAAPEALDIAGGLVWLVGPNGQSASHATRVQAGVYITWAGKRNLEASINAEAERYRARISELESQVKRLRESPADSSARLTESPPSYPAPCVEQEGGLRAWHVLVGVAVLFGGGYVLGRYKR